MQARGELLRSPLRDACLSVYGQDLITVAIFGSWARGAATPVSDIDVLIVAEGLPAGRRARVTGFEPVEALTLELRQRLWDQPELVPQLSPVIKTPEEVHGCSPLFLDMTDWCEILWDRDEFFGDYLKTLKAKMKKLGSVRRPLKGGYYWEYKPEIRPTEVVEL